MFPIGFYLAQYIDWCAALSHRVKRWQVVLVDLAFVAGFFGLVAYAPGWVSIVWLGVFGIPLGVFGSVDRRVQFEKRKDAEAKRSQLNKTQKLLRGFRK
ncbi:hypothetical protein [Phaeobacter sp. HF9A]|uniref:hypothetical protein n=1 Tax=Phaeobacter sp. HF9A TaxID=2721561 RepID=UPI00142F9B0E|nr:hypothetical protein [Phaeobacter sp. HF9A]NIZ15017.1 hypothetical protein [Phaeobacter sp. HF9A]